MNCGPQRITLDQWDRRYAELVAGGLREPAYGGPLRRHAEDGDRRLLSLRMDNSPGALRLWNFLLSEEERLHAARTAGKRLVGAMKDLGTVPVMAFALPELVAFYPDGAWWLPCMMEHQDRLLAVADSLGIDEAFCPVRAMLGAFVTGAHFPLPDLLTCSVGATCDDFSAVAQRLESIGHAILWWEIPHRRRPEAGEADVALPGGFSAPAEQVAVVRSELERVRAALAALAGTELTDARLAEGIAAANRFRVLLRALRQAAYTADPCPLPALEMLVAEMLAVHFCSDREEATTVLTDLLEETRRRIAAGEGVLPRGAARIYWINPVADLKVMNLLEDVGGRICGSEYLFCHAIEAIPEDRPPMDALAAAALADPMVGPATDRAGRIAAELASLGAEAVVISRVPGASHCAWEGTVLGRVLRRTGLPVAEVEVPPLTDATAPALVNRLEALVETALSRRRP